MPAQRRDLRRLAPREAEIRRRTGLLIDPYFSATKLKWMLDSDRTLRRRAARGELCFGTIDCWLIFRLSRGHAFVTDFTNASRTMMFNLKERNGTRRCSMFGVPPEMLPEPVGSRGPLAEAAAGIFAPRAIPIGAAIGDQQSALFGQRAVSPGAAKVTYGTGAFLLMHTGERAVTSRNRLVDHRRVGTGRRARLRAGGLDVHRGRGDPMAPRRDRHYRDVGRERKARASEPRSLTAYLVPAFVGLGAPYWDAGARGAIVGITRGTIART